MNETDKPILDACCGSRMFWKDHHNPNVLYVDNRVLKCQPIWKSNDGRSTRYCEVSPDIVADFTALPFADNTFCHVVFDPPHLVNVGKTSWMANCGEAQVKDTNDYSVFKNAWSSGRFFTYTRSDGMWKIGCFHGTGKELIAKAYKDSELSGKCYEAIVRVQEAIDRARNAHAEKNGDMNDPK